jgi:two-component system LytT family response regulator
VLKEPETGTSAATRARHVGAAAAPDVGPANTKLVEVDVSPVPPFATLRAVPSVRLEPAIVLLPASCPYIVLAEMLLERKFKGNVVFTTAYNAYAIKAFRLSAIDYLLKPIQEDQLTEAVEKLKQEKKIRDNEIRLKVLAENLQENKNEVLCVPTQGGFDYIPLDELEYIEADGSYVKIFCNHVRSRTVSKNLKYFENALAENQNFVRPHRSFLVNINCVTGYLKSEGGFLILKNSAQIPVSRDRKQAILDLLK